MANRSNKPWDKEVKASSPSGGWGSLPGNLRPLADLPGELTPHKRGDITVLIHAQSADLADLTRRVWRELNAKLVAAGGQMTVAEEELLRYFATGIYHRVRWVTRNTQRGDIRPDDKWALPVAMHMVIGAIGIVETSEGLRYVPQWVAPTQAAGEVPLIMSRDEWEEVTSRLLALEPFGLRFVKGYEKEISGVEKVMTLVRVDDPDETFFYAWVPPHALEALIAAVLGVSRTEPVDVRGLPRDFIPTYRIRGSWVLSFMHDFARMNEHRDVA